MRHFQPMVRTPRTDWKAAGATEKLINWRSLNPGYERTSETFRRNGNNFRRKLFRVWTPYFTGITFWIIPVTYWRPENSLAPPVAARSLALRTPIRSRELIRDSQWSKVKSVCKSRRFALFSVYPRGKSSWNSPDRKFRALQDLYRGKKSLTPPEGRTAIFFLQSSHYPE
jgi:hypothetical protein